MNLKIITILICLLVIFSINYYWSRRIKRLRILKTLEENNGEWKARINVKNDYWKNCTETKAIDPINGKSYRYDEVEFTQEYEAFLEIIYTIIINPREKTSYAKKVILYLPSF